MSAKWLPMIAGGLVCAVFAIGRTGAQETSQPEATWTPSPECRALFAEAGAKSTAGEPMNREDAVALEDCKHQVLRHTPLRDTDPTWPRIPPAAPVQKRDFSVPSPSSAADPLSAFRFSLGGSRSFNRRAGEASAGEPLRRNLNLPKQGV